MSKKAYTGDLNAYVQAAQPRLEDMLSRLVAVPTVSSDKRRRQDITKGANLAATFMEEAGLKTETVATSGNPVIFGQLIQGQSYPTVTLYNHMDVQPADRTDWQTEPFQLVIKNNQYIGRGATDDKGPALTALLAIDYARKRKLPLNFKVVWEFEEEIGSPHFEEFVKNKAHELITDSIVVSDTIWLSAGKPAIPYSLRGVMSFEVSLRTARKEVHSGLTGGVARNPIGELAQIISECYDAVSGRVHVPGFYDDVQPATAEELDNFVASGFDTKQFMADHELLSLRTNDTRQVLSRIMAEPTFEVHGVTGGYTGEGVKTAIAPSATAKLSTRLVPTQDAKKVFKLIKKFITDQHPDAIVTMEAAAQPYLADISGAYADAARAAMKSGFGTKPAFVREGGSIGAVLTMQQYLGVPIMLLGLSLPEHGYHAPNEYFDWHQASGGIKMFATYFAEIAKLPK